MFPVPAFYGQTVFVVAFARDYKGVDFFFWGGGGELQIFTLIGNTYLDNQNKLRIFLGKGLGQTLLRVSNWGVYA